MASAIKRFVITGDLLRPDDAGRHTSQTTNIMWLAGLISAQIREATGLDVRAITNETGDFDFYNAYRSVGLKPGFHEWGKLYQSVPAVIQAAWTDQLRGSFVVGFELPPSICNILREAGIPFIECLTHPIRFMDDIFFGMRSSSPAINCFLASRALPRRKVFAAAGIISAKAYRQGAVPREESFSLFAGQAPIDRSMIVDGQLRNAASLRTEIIEAIGAPKLLKFRDHPLVRSDEAFDVVASAYNQVERTDQYTYALLANPALESVATISSSIGVEAGFFGKRASYAIGPSTPVLFADDVDDSRSYWSIFNDYMGADFWREVLSSEMPVTRRDYDGPIWRPNLLRSTLGLSWGYGETLSVPSPTPEVPSPTPEVSSPTPEGDFEKPRGLRKLRREIARPARQLKALISALKH